MRYLLLCLLFSTATAQQPDHNLFTPVLSGLVNENGLVDYRSLAAHPEVLTHYLNELITHSPQQTWSREEVLAYWINTYNAFTLKLVADHYPLRSIRDLKEPWDRELIPYRGRKISLNHVEHRILRKMEEPRIHFAINCASLSCPVLAREAYTADQLDEQLNLAAQRFINDPDRNRINANRLQLSKIFKWFQKDFTSQGSLIDFISGYSHTAIDEHAGIEFLEYNWNLNEQ